MEDTTFPKQSGTKHTPLIQQIRHRIRILRQRRCEENTLVQFTHTFQELVHMGPLQYVHLVNGAIDLHRHYEICIAYWLKQTRECVNFSIRKRISKMVLESLSQKISKLTLKLLCTNVSSKSITIHFLCIS